MIKNSFWNIGGFVVPSLIAIPAMGVIARILGVELFGLFTIFFTIFGFASILDAGLSRAVIREVSIYRSDSAKLVEILSTSLITVLVVSVVGSMIFYMSSSAIASAFSVSAEHFQDVVLALKIISISFPFMLVSQIYTGVLEGLENFRSINLQKTITGSILALLPLFFILSDASLSAGVAGLALARIISTFINHYCVDRHVRITLLAFDRIVCRQLLSNGGWVSVSNLVSPLILYCDRFVLANMFGAKNVAFYTAPSEVVNRISVFPNAISRVLFPLFSHSQAQGFKDKSVRNGYLLVTGSAILVSLPFFLFPDLILNFWVGKEYGCESANILIVLLIGMLVNSMAQVEFAEIQAKGYFKVTAIIHVVELVPYFCILFFLLDMYGLIGAACASTFRAALDFVFLLVFNRLVSHEKK
ncbi:flippase [Pseudomonas sp. LRF_L74]|uniref:flippase n=1 Tax=Pseudomonas sp. LRF_L74 TaxID=3369422 RepID=UPI003F5DAF6E